MGNALQGKRVLVVGRGSGDKIFITTSGIGVIRDEVDLSSSHVRPGDAILVSGNLGDQGIAILSQREGTEFDEPIHCVKAPLHELVATMLDAFSGVHEMRDNVFAELKSTIHFSNRSGVRASCPDCHVPHNWTDKIARKMQASKEVWGKVFGTISTRQKFVDQRRGA